MRRQSVLAVFGAVAVDDVRSQSAVLPADEAFRLRVRRAGPRSIELLWLAAPGTHLYRDRMSATSRTPAVRVTGVELPPAQAKFDKVLDRDVAYYEGSVLLRVSYSGPAVPFTLVAAAQGCAEAAGICYQPVVHELDISGVSP